jgi:TPR repeat protein
MAEPVGDGPCRLQDRAWRDHPEEAGRSKGAPAPKSEKRAYEHYLRAAVWGEEQSVYEVGRCLFYGIGVARDRRLAQIWYDRAETLGDFG